MTSKQPNRIFWIIASLALFWNLMGLLAFASQVFMTSEMLAELPPDQARLISDTPQWLTGIFAVATITGFLGSIFLILRRKIAITLFFISLIGVFIQMGYSFFATDAVAVYGWVQGVVLPIFVIVIAIYLYFFSRTSAKKGYFR